MKKHAPKIMNTHRLSQHGFTLVELMVTLVVAFLVIAAVYASHKVQQQTHKAQIQVTEIQQNLRAAMDMITREFRLAKYDPMDTGNYGILSGTASSLRFTGDLCEEKDPPNDPNASGANCQASSPYAGQNIQETYLYEHYDSDLDGTPDAIRRTPGGPAIAENIEKLDLRYILNTGIELPTLPGAQRDNVRAIKVSILARASEPDYKYTDATTYDYATGLKWDPSKFPNSSCKNNNCLNYRRRVLVATIDMRNIDQN